MRVRKTLIEKSRRRRRKQRGDLDESVQLFFLLPAVNSQQRSRGKNVKSGLNRNPVMKVAFFELSMRVQESRVEDSSRELKRQS